MKVQALKALSFLGKGSLTPFQQRTTSTQHMPKVPSLLFDMEMEEGKESKPNDLDQFHVTGVISQLKSLLHPWTTQEAHLTSHMRLVQDVLLGNGEQELDVLEVAEGLRRLGHSVVIRTALGGGGGGECLRNLRHTFLTCTVAGPTPSGQRPVSYIVDPAFREQFEIAHASERYTEILAHVPRVFIGSQDRVGPLVELLCSEISAAFKQAGATLPPWRASAAMLSKWRPRRSADCVLGDDEQVPGLAAAGGPFDDAAPLQSRAASLPIAQPPSLSLNAGAGRRPTIPPGLVQRRNSDSKPQLSPAVQLTIHRADSVDGSVDQTLSSQTYGGCMGQAARHVLHVL